jgi:uncharacterized membrane protein
MYLPHGIENPGTGIASDVNNWGEAVGTSTMVGGSKMAMYWDAGGNPTPLPSPLGGNSKAHAINNQGYVAGTGWESTTEESPQQAFLWRPDGAPPCHLDPGGMNSGARGVTEVVTDGSGSEKVFVAGYSESVATVWEVEVRSCNVGRTWTAETESHLNEIRVLNDGWEAAGSGHFVTSGSEHPMVWSFTILGGLTTTPVAEDGKAWAITDDGRIVGQGPVKGAIHPILWVPVEQ